jgi:hypothetical protein
MLVDVLRSFWMLTGVMGGARVMEVTRVMRVRAILEALLKVLLNY